MNYDKGNLERSRKRRQAILDLLNTRGPMTSTEMREALEDAPGLYITRDTIRNTLNKMHERGEVEFLPGKILYRKIRALVAETFVHDMSSNIRKAREVNPACKRGYKRRNTYRAIKNDNASSSCAGVRVVRLLDRPARQNSSGGQGAVRQFPTIRSSLL